MYRVCLLFLLVNFGVSYTSQVTNPRVTIENGVVVGKYQTSYGGKPFRAFLGIPYAKPPVGDLRFQEPQRLEEKWTGEFNASYHGSECLQYDQYNIMTDKKGEWEYTVHGEEDCLFINVYSHEQGTNKDVVFFIHGGAYTFGSGDFHGPDYIMDHDDIVYVTFNYRLGPLGFLSTGDSVVPGNNGMKDQVAALEWVQRNIAAFGGDPKKVTLAGLSAGGASVHLHYLSPLSKGLFQRGISYSGVAICPCITLPWVADQSKTLAHLVGCPTSDSKTMVECLKQRPAKQIVHQTDNYKVFRFNPAVIFGPAVEKDSRRPFINQSPLDIIKQGKAHDLPWIAAVTSEDGLYPAAEFVESTSILDRINKDWNHLAPYLYCYYDKVPKSKQDEISKKIRESYMGKADISKSNTKQLIKMTSDGFFIAPAVKVASLQSQKSKQPVHFYYFSYRGAHSFSTFMSHSNTDLGVCHGDDVQYVTNMEGLDAKSTQQDSKMSDLLLDMLVTYAKTGKTPEYLKWEEVPKSGISDFKYLGISSPTQFKMENNPKLGNTELWNRIIETEGRQKEEL